jgi:hypothetical protein
MTFFSSPLKRKNEAPSFGVFFKMSTVIYMQNKFRWSYLESVEVK